MNRIRKILPLVSQAFLALTYFMLANNIFFYHEHDLESGETIRHAHPFFSEEEEQQRDHSENELILLDLVTHGQYFLPERVNLVEHVLVSTPATVTTYVIFHVTSASQAVPTLRGPPSNNC